jgi:hypothetical protein
MSVGWHIAAALAGSFVILLVFWWLFGRRDEWDE